MYQEIDKVPDEGSQPEIVPFHSTYYLTVLYFPATYNIHVYLKYNFALKKHILIRCFIDSHQFYNFLLLIYAKMQ